MTGTLANLGFDTTTGNARFVRDYLIATPPQEDRPKPLPEPPLSVMTRLAEYLPPQKPTLTESMGLVVRAFLRVMSSVRVEAASRGAPLQPTMPQVAPIRPQVRAARQEMSAKAFTMHMEHLSFLKHVSTGERPSITPDTARSASTAWRVIWRASDYKMPVPAAGTGPDGEMFYAWNAGRYHLELEIIPGQPAEFFYRDRETGEFWGEDYEVGAPLPAKIVAKLGLFQ